MGARAYRKSVLQLGLITAPVSVYSAVEKPVSNRTLCTDGHTPTGVKQTVACPTCGKTDGFVKGREVAKDTFVLIDQADLDAAAAEGEPFKAVINLTPHPAEQMTDMLPAGDKVYYLGPQPGGNDTFALLHDRIAAHPELVFTTVYAVAGSPAMYQIRCFGDTLVLVELAWPAALKEQPTWTGTPNPALVAMADQFLTTLITDFDASTYVDKGRARLDEIVAAGTAVTSTATPGASTAAPSAADALLAALSAAVQGAGATPAPAKRVTKKKEVQPA